MGVLYARTAPDEFTPIPSGPPGPAGAPGPTGPEGPAGPPGAAAANDEAWLTGYGAPGAALGAVGDFYVDEGTGIIYGPRSPTTFPGAVLIEQFDNLTAWTNSGAAITTAGRTGNGVNVGSLDDITYRLPVPSESDILIIGMAVKPTSVSSTFNLLEFRSDAGATVHTALNVQGSSKYLALMRGGSPLGPSSPNDTFVVGVWQYIEVRLKLHDTAGEYEVRVDGDPRHRADDRG